MVKKMRTLKLVVFILLIPVELVFADIDPWNESYRLESVYQIDAALNALNNISSDNELVLLRRGWLNYLKGAHSKAIEFYNKALNKNSKSLDARLGIILPLLSQQRWREAASNANKALETAPWNYHAHIRLMVTEEALKQWSQLDKHAQAVHERYPSDATVLVYLARANYRLGNESIAINMYQKVQEILPDHFEASQFAK